MTLKDENETHLYKFPTLNFIMKGLWPMKQTWYMKMTVDCARMV